jgi:hypothetical protein
VLCFNAAAFDRTLSFRDGFLIELREFSDAFDAVEQALARWLVV